MSKFNLYLTAFLLSCGAAGCSSISGSGTSQPISVQTFSSDGQELQDARCEMTNDEGTWFVTTPGTSIVRRSNKDLQIICKKITHNIGTANVVSKTKMNMYGNIVFGVGAIIDHNNGSAYEYPSMVKIYMGKNQKIDHGTIEIKSFK